MKEIVFRPLREVKKTDKIVVASYAQWRKVKVADYSHFKLIINDEYRDMDRNAFVHNHKGDCLFWKSHNPDLIPLINQYEYEYDSFQSRVYPEMWKTDYGMYSVQGIDVDGVPTFSHNTALNIANLDNINGFEPLTVKVALWWFGWFLYQLKNNDLLFLND